MPKLTFTNRTLTVEREPGDPKFYGVRAAKGESNFLHWLKKILNQDFGYDLIKKRMWKDGHLVDEYQQYLRTRSPKSKGPKVAIYNHGFMIEGAEIPWNQNGKVILSIEPDIFESV